MQYGLGFSNMTATPGYLVDNQFRETSDTIIMDPIQAGGRMTDAEMRAYEAGNGLPGGVMTAGVGKGFPLWLLALLAASVWYSTQG